MRSRVGADLGASDEYEDAVLVVADDAATRQSLASVLASAEIEAYGAEPDEALAAQALYHPAIALVEHAPGLLDGLALSAGLKQADPEIPVLLLTDPAFLASAQPSELVDQYLVKPLATAAFVQTVRNALTRRGLSVAYRHLAERAEPTAPTPVHEVAAEAATAPPAPAPQHATPVPPAPVPQAPLPPTPFPYAPVPSAPVQSVPVAPVQLAPVPVAPAPVPPAPVQAVQEPSLPTILTHDESHAGDRLPEATQPEAADELRQPVQIVVPVPQPIVVEDALRAALSLTAPAHRTAAVLLVRLEVPEGSSLSWHEHGETILAWAAREVSGARRSTDRVAAAGPQSLVVVCPDVDSADTAEVIAASVTKDLARHIALGPTSVRLGVTIGIVLTGSAGDIAEDPEAILEDASIAVRSAAEEGRPWKLFDGSIGEGARLRERLLRAMANGELDLDFQKVVDLQTGKIVGAEAYLRWHRPGSETICAGEFLDKAYEAGMAGPLGRWVLDHALSELAAWRAGNVLADGFKLYVNVGAEELAVPEFADTVDKLLREHGASPTMLTIEMPEAALSVAVADANALRALKRLGDLGVDCVVDDFGTGRSNLDWLHELPVTGLKINPELVSVLDDPEDRRGTALVRGVIALGHELQMTVVGEGVESVSQAVALRAMGCDLAQGHHLGRPERSAELAAAIA